MYLFVFFWSAALKSAHALANKDLITSTTPATDLPFGIIFSSFMSGMMLGSLGFTLATAAVTNDFGTKKPFFASSSLLTMSIAGASTCLLLAVIFKSECIIFWAFCFFEVCVGVYYPSMGHQKGKIVDDGVRAKVYGILRIPLNVFVVLTLSLTTEGDAHRDHVFVFCGGLLLLASIAAGYYLEDEQKGYEELPSEARVE